MATVTKKDLIDRIAEASGCKRADVKKIVQHFMDELIVELARGNRLEFRDFGVLETKERAARVAQNPKTLQRINVPAKRTVKFKVGRLLKEQLDAPPAVRTRADVLKRIANGSIQEDAHPERPKVVVKSGIGSDGKMTSASKANSDLHRH